MKYLFIDFDGFFAAVEQQYRPELRGKPVAVVPSAGVETTSCIAASYEAKAFGVKTGVRVRDARFLCPQVQFVEANHARYVRVHNQVKEALEPVLHIEQVMSIDEMYGRLPPHWRSHEVAREKALEIKSALAMAVGPHITGSIGIGPNRFTAKMASKMEKPNGLVLIEQHQLPEALNRLKLEDIYGIGKAMFARLNRRGVHTTEDLGKLSRERMHDIWGSVQGDRLYAELRGVDIAYADTHRRTVGHQHVLSPALRNTEGSHAVLHQLLQKACRRLRAMGYYASEVHIGIKFGFDFRWGQEMRTFPTQDTVTLAQCLEKLWERQPKDMPAPTKVSITLMGLVHERVHTPSLFEEDNQGRRVQLQRAMDGLNARYGGRTVYYANSHTAQRNRSTAPMRIAFNHIPNLDMERD